jgi:hypothetical protein
MKQRTYTPTENAVQDWAKRFDLKFIPDDSPSTALLELSDVVNNEDVMNGFCATGQGGGNDNSCGGKQGGKSEDSKSSGSHASSDKNKPAPKAGAKSDSASTQSGASHVSDLKAASASDPATKQMAARLGKLGAGLKAGEHVATEFVKDGVNKTLAKLPGPLRIAAEKVIALGAVGTKVAFAGWSASSALAERVAKERGMSPEQAVKLRGTLHGIDMVAFKPAALASHVLIGPLSIVPPATGAYLAYSTARNPMATARAAAGLVKDAVKGLSDKVKRKKSENQFVFNLEADDPETKNLIDVLEAHDFDDWFIALFLMALDETEDVGQALKIAAQLYQENPTDPSETDDGGDDLLQPAPTENEVDCDQIEDIRQVMEDVGVNDDQIDDALAEIEDSCVDNAVKNMDASCDDLDDVEDLRQSLFDDGFDEEGVEDIISDLEETCVNNVEDTAVVNMDEEEAQEACIRATLMGGDASDDEIEAALEALDGSDWDSDYADAIDEDCFPENAFCPTGPGGGQDNSCGAGGGGSHASAVKEGDGGRPISSALPKGAIIKLARDKGFSFVAGQKKYQKIGQEGYAVSPYPDRGAIYSKRVFIKQIRDFMDKNADLLKQPDHAVGAWRERSTGKTYLDVSVVTHDRDKAIELGKKHNQIAIFDFKNGATIDTGGDGKNTKNESNNTVDVENVFCSTGSGGGVDPSCGKGGGSGQSTSEAGAQGFRDGGRLSGSAQRVESSSPALDPNGPHLRGSPTSANIPGIGTVAVQPNPVARQAAVDYMKSAGLPYNPPADYVKVDKDRAIRIAKAFEEMKHDPHDPEVAKAYDAMIKETTAQYDALIKTGLKVEFIDYAKQGDPYAASPRMAIEDIKNNSHFWVFPTDAGFGSNSAFDASKNPLLASTGHTISGKPALANDLFRVVHDYFGHAKEGNGMRADGEENAWRMHSAMYSPLARRAMTTETRGQNSYVNFGPDAAHNKTASGADTKYADQKVGLLPQWVTDEGSGRGGTENAKYTFKSANCPKCGTPAVDEGDPDNGKCNRCGHMWGTPTENEFCPTGPGGGVDPSCSPKKSGGAAAESPKGDMRLKLKNVSDLRAGDVIVNPRGQEHKVAKVEKTEGGHVKVEYEGAKFKPQAQRAGRPLFSAGVAKVKLAGGGEHVVTVPKVPTPKPSTPRPSFGLPPAVPIVQRPPPGGKASVKGLLRAFDPALAKRYNKISHELVAANKVVKAGNDPGGLVAKRANEIKAEMAQIRADARQRFGDQKNIPQDVIRPQGQKAPKPASDLLDPHRALGIPKPEPLKPEQARLLTLEKSPEQTRLAVSDESSRDHLGGGINGSYKVTLSNGAVGAWKPADEEPNRRIRDHIPPQTSYLREAAAYDVAKAVGVHDLVPPTVIREINGKIGSMQEFQQGAKVALDTYVRNPYLGRMPGPETFDGEKDLARAAAFDVLIGSTDRHAKNWMLKDDGNGVKNCA